MNTYGLTLQDCEDLIRAVRSVPRLWNRDWGFFRLSQCQCVIGAAFKADVRLYADENEIILHGPTDGALAAHPRIGRFAIDWFYPMAERMDDLNDIKPGSSGLRWLTLLKLKAIREVLLDEAEQREEISRWAPAVKERVVQESKVLERSKA